MLNGEGTNAGEGRGIISRLKEWFSKFAETEEDELDGIVEGDTPKKEKLQNSLLQCLHYLDCLFQTTDTDQQRILKTEMNETLENSLTSPDRTNSFSRPSNRTGVEGNIMNNPDNVYKLEYMGDPVLRPIQPHENKFLCKHLHRLSLFLNRKFAPQLIYVSENPDLIVSRAASIVLNERPPPSPLEHIQQSECKLPRLRINLRPLASYHILSLIFFGYTLPTMIGITSIQLICIFSLFFAIFFFTQFISSANN